VLCAEAWPVIKTNASRTAKLKAFFIALLASHLE
jgi:hypothetical protein